MYKLILFLFVMASLHKKNKDTEQQENATK
jgi:hypothetical protein